MPEPEEQRDEQDDLRHHLVCAVVDEAQNNAVETRENGDDANINLEISLSSSSLLCVWEGNGQELQACVVHRGLRGQQEAQVSPAFHPEVNVEFPGDHENRETHNERARLPHAIWNFLLRLPSEDANQSLCDQLGCL